jgi:hypothetical protein
MAIPRDLLDEIHRELVESSRLLSREAARLSELIELNRLAAYVSLRLGRTVSVVELFEELGDEPGARVAELVRSLRDEEGRHERR